MAKKTINKEKYIIGIDSGATSSEVVIVQTPLSPPFAKGGKALVRGVYKKYPPINFNVLGFDETAKRLIYIIEDSSKKIGLENIAYIVAGISGARNEKDRNNIAITVSKSLGFDNIKILPDTEIAFYSVFAHNQTNCGILIAGTGSVLYYKDSQGTMKRIGGWGRLLGDEGSGWWIAREALSQTVKNFDRTHKPNNISVMLKNKFGLHEDNIIEEIYHKNFEISRITKEIFRRAEKNDNIAAGIVKQAAEHLAEHLVQLGKIECTIALCGSLFTEEKFLEKHLKKIAKVKLPNINFIKPKQEPVWGAVEIGKMLCHCES